MDQSKSQKKNQIIFLMEGNENTTYQKLWAIPKAVIRVKFIGTANKANRRKEIKVRREAKEVENRKNIKENQGNQKLFCF